MKKLVITLLLTMLFLYGCIRNFGTNYCGEASDCQGLEPSIDCVGTWKCENNVCTFVCEGSGEDVTIDLVATPVTGETPLLVHFQAFIDYSGHEREYYCTEFAWNFGEGQEIIAMPGCLPYEEGLAFQKVYENWYTYTKPGTYETTFRLKDVKSHTVTITVVADEKAGCAMDADCVPATCCHPTKLVNKQYAPTCEEVVCTESCEGPLDCGAGHATCQEGLCVIVPNREL